MYENYMFIGEDDTKENKLKALESYDLSLRLYNKYHLNTLDKTRVLNRIGWIRYTILLEANNWHNIPKIQKEIEAIEKIFNESYELDNKKAKLGLLNIQVVKYSLINDIPERNLVVAKSLIKEALDINSNHLPTPFTCY